MPGSVTKDRAALAHAAGELVRIMPPESGQPHELQGGLDPCRRFLGGNAARHEAEANIGLDAHPGEEAALLEHHRVLDRPARRLDLDRAAGLGGEPREDAQQRRFPAARWSDDADEFAWRDAQVDVVEGNHATRTAQVFLAQSDDVDRRAAPLDGH